MEDYMHKTIFYAVYLLVLALAQTSCGVLYAYPRYRPQWTTVEKNFLKASNRQSIYEEEYFPIIEVKDQVSLGKLIALRFIEWVQHNPNGVVSFTTGSTPEYFIKYLNYYKNNWHSSNVQAELRRYGIVCADFPKTSNLRLVQSEELYPLSEKQYHKLSNYTLRHYVKILNIKPENLLLIDIDKKGIIAEKGMNIVFMNSKVDLSLLEREPNSQLEVWQKRALYELVDFCKEYEKKIRAWGGIDFYVGGLCYGGNLNFNESSGSFDSITHFTKLDNITSAHLAQDFGGIEYARNKIAITIGLGTIMFKPKAVKIIIAAGQGKAKAVFHSVTRKDDILFPATALQACPNSRFYITASAAKFLESRQAENLYLNTINGWSQKNIEDVIISISISESTPILYLNSKSLNKYARGRLLLANSPKNLEVMLKEVHNSLVNKIENSLKLSMHKHTKILHAAPHHEDVMLSYYPLLDYIINKYDNYFVHFTSSYDSVRDAYILNTLSRVDDVWINKKANMIFNDSYANFLTKYNIAFIKNDVQEMRMLETANCLQQMAGIYDIKNIVKLKEKIRWLKDSYFPSKQPGDLDDSQIITLKSMIRESEADRLLTIKKVPLQNIYHLRSSFHSDRIFTSMPHYSADILPFIKIYNRIQPKVLLVLDDPQISAQSTNYKVLQIICQALRLKETVVDNNLKIIGYRDRWFSYNVEDADIFVPVSEFMLNLQQKIYDSCFVTQQKACFPSPFFDCSSAILMDTTQRMNLYKLYAVLGAEYFFQHPNPAIRMARGFIFLHRMSLNELLSRTEELLFDVELDDKSMVG